MTFYLPPDYLDNTDQRNLADALTCIVRDWEQRELDVASGFFEPDAWRYLRDAFLLLNAFRLLLGKAPELEGTRWDRIDLRDYYRRKLQGDLKAELNLVRKEEAVARALRQDWFESFWAEAEDYKDDLIQALEASKFGTAPYSPFQVFIKALYEYFKERLAPEAPEAFIGVDLATFQQEGLREAIRLLDRHRGVIIADAVGLGKTYIGMGLLEHYLLRKRRRGYIPKGLIVCPAQLRELLWGPKLDEYDIKVTIRSMEELGRQDFDWKAFNGYDLVLIDEAHNFRNPGTGRSRPRSCRSSSAPTCSRRDRISRTRVPSSTTTCTGTRCA